MRGTETHTHLTILDNVPIFSCLLPDERSKLSQIIKERHYKRNAIILMEDDSKNFMYIIFSGKIKVVRINPDGKEQILVIRKRGDFFGEMTLLDGKSQPATIVAMDDTVVGLISKSDFDEYFMKDTNVLKEIISMLCERLRESWVMMRLLGHPDAETRVRAVLAHISSIYGIKDTRGVMIPFKLTHKEIADFAALTRETVSRLMARLNQSGEIEIIGTRTIILKPAFFTVK
jgi:CRP/FNR family cyclic AMP-dependent transcriptional regulator